MREITACDNELLRLAACKYKLRRKLDTVASDSQAHSSLTHELARVHRQIFDTLGNQARAIERYSRRLHPEHNAYLLDKYRRELRAIGERRRLLLLMRADFRRGARRRPTRAGHS